MVKIDNKEDETHLHLPALRLEHLWGQVHGRAAHRLHERRFVHHTRQPEVRELKVSSLAKHSNRNPS